MDSRFKEWVYIEGLMQSGAGDGSHHARNQLLPCY